MKKVAASQGRLKIIPWEVIKANEDSARGGFNPNEDDSDDFFALDESDQQNLPILTLPEQLQQKLFNHQQYGVNWMYNLFCNKEKGAILADDMGLGKTLQVTSFLAGTILEGKICTSLVLTPKSVIPGWEREINNNLKIYLPDVNVTVIDAGMKKKQRTTLLTEIEESNRQTKHIIIMSHHLLLTMIEEVGRIVWDCVVLDEGHIIKNTTTKMSQTMHQLQSPFRLLLSGTPIQNDLKEFWALVNWATQGSRFGREIEFRKDFADPILRGQDPGAGDRCRSLASEARRNLVRVIRPILLRRKKADQRQKELQLPEKKELVLWIRLSTKQRQQYYEYVNSNHFEEVMRQATYPVEVINTLKTICRHPILLKAAAEQKEIDDLDVALQRMGLQDTNDVPVASQDTTGFVKGHYFDILGRVPNKDELLAESTKLRVLARMTSRLIKADHRILIFSQSKRMLEIIQYLFVEYGYPTFKIDGSTSGEERQYIIDQFNSPEETYSGPKICLLTTKACGVGINLVGADRVIIFDPSWNPAEDSQAVDRAYRIGQTKPVIVYRLIHSSCVEEKVYQKQVFKEGLRVISEKGNETKRYFSEKSQLRDLLALGGKDAVDILRHVPNKMDLLQLDSLFGMDSVIGCTRHDRLYKEDRQPPADIAADTTNYLPATQHHQQEQEVPKSGKKAATRKVFEFEENEEDENNRHPTNNDCDAIDSRGEEEEVEWVEDLTGTDDSKKPRRLVDLSRMSVLPFIDLTQEEKSNACTTSVSQNDSNQDDNEEEETFVVKKVSFKKKKIFLEDDEDQDHYVETKIISEEPLENNAVTTVDGQVANGLSSVETITDGSQDGGTAVAYDNAIDEEEAMPLDQSVEAPDAIESAETDNAFQEGSHLRDETTAVEEENAQISEDDAGQDKIDDNDIDDDQFTQNIDKITEKDPYDEDYNENDEAEEEDDDDGFNLVITSSIESAHRRTADENLSAVSNQQFGLCEIQDNVNQQPPHRFVDLVSMKELRRIKQNNLTSDNLASSQPDNGATVTSITTTATDEAIGENSFAEERNVSSSQESSSSMASKNDDFLEEQPSLRHEDETDTHQGLSSAKYPQNNSKNYCNNPGLLNQYCNVSLFSPNASSINSSINVSALNMSAFDNHHTDSSRRSSTESMISSGHQDNNGDGAIYDEFEDSASQEVISEECEDKKVISICHDSSNDTKNNTNIVGAKEKFRKSLCDRKRQFLYQQITHPKVTATIQSVASQPIQSPSVLPSQISLQIPITPVRESDTKEKKQVGATATSTRKPTSGYLSRIKIMGSSVKKDPTSRRTNFAPINNATSQLANTNNDDIQKTPKSSTPFTSYRGFVDQSYMDSDEDEDEDNTNGSQRYSTNKRLSFRVPINDNTVDNIITSDKENVSNCITDSSQTSSAPSVSKQWSSSSRFRSQSDDIPCEIASELARIVEASHEHAAEEEQRRYDEEFDRQQQSSSVDDLLQQLSSLNMQDIVRGKQLALEIVPVHVLQQEQNQEEVQKTLRFDDFSFSN